MTRRRGAQPGNNNAYKHGFYSGSFMQLENELLSLHESERFEDESNLMRVLIKRTTDKLAETNDLSLEDYLSALCTISFAMAVLERINRSNRQQLEGADQLPKDNIE